MSHEMLPRAGRMKIERNVAKEARVRIVTLAGEGRGSCQVKRREAMRPVRLQRGNMRGDTAAITATSKGWDLGNPRPEGGCPNSMMIDFGSGSSSGLVALCTGNDVEGGVVEGRTNIRSLQE